MEELTVFITQANDGDYLAHIPLIPGVFVRGGSPEEAFEKMKRHAQQWIERHGFKRAQLVFRTEFGAREIEEVKAAHERGECQELDEAFAEVAGVSLEEWRRRVNAHSAVKDS